LPAVVFTVLGLAILLTGVAFVYWPAALIIGGSLLACFGLFAIGVGEQ
jgi:hypothetical protein